MYTGTTGVSGLGIIGTAIGSANAIIITIIILTGIGIITWYAIKQSLKK